MGKSSKKIPKKGFFNPYYDSDTSMSTDNMLADLSDYDPYNEPDFVEGWGNSRRNSRRDSLVGEYLDLMRKPKNPDSRFVSIEGDNDKWIDVDKRGYFKDKPVPVKRVALKTDGTMDKIRHALGIPRDRTIVDQFMPQKEYQALTPKQREAIRQERIKPIRTGIPKAAGELFDRVNPFKNKVVEGVKQNKNPLLPRRNFEEENPDLDSFTGRPYFNSDAGLARKLQNEEEYQEFLREKGLPSARQKSASEIQKENEEDAKLFAQLALDEEKRRNPIVQNSPRGLTPIQDAADSSFQSVRSNNHLASPEQSFHSALDISDADLEPLRKTYDLPKMQTYPKEYFPPKWQSPNLDYSAIERFGDDDSDGNINYKAPAIPGATNGHQRFLENKQRIKDAAIRKNPMLAFPEVKSADEFKAVNDIRSNQNPIQQAGLNNTPPPMPPAAVPPAPPPVRPVSPTKGGLTMPPPMPRPLIPTKSSLTMSRSIPSTPLPAPAMTGIPRTNGGFFDKFNPFKRKVSDLDFDAPRPALPTKRLHREPHVTYGGMNPEPDDWMDSSSENSVVEDDAALARKLQNEYDAEVKQQGLPAIHPKRKSSFHNLEDKSYMQNLQNKFNEEELQERQRLNKIQSSKDEALARQMQNDFNANPQSGNPIQQAGLGNAPPPAFQMPWREDPKLLAHFKGIDADMQDFLKMKIPEKRLATNTPLPALPPPVRPSIPDGSSRSHIGLHNLYPQKTGNDSLQAAGVMPKSPTAFAWKTPQNNMAPAAPLQALPAPEAPQSGVRRTREMRNQQAAQREQTPEFISKQLGRNDTRTYNSNQFVTETMRHFPKNELPKIEHLSTQEIDMKKIPRISSRLENTPPRQRFSPGGIATTPSSLLKKPYTLRTVPGLNGQSPGGSLPQAPDIGAIGNAPAPASTTNPLVSAGNAAAGPATIGVRNALSQSPPPVAGNPITTPPAAPTIMKDVVHPDAATMMKPSATPPAALSGVQTPEIAPIGGGKDASLDAVKANAGKSTWKSMAKTAAKGVGAGLINVGLEAASAPSVEAEAGDNTTSLKYGDGFLDATGMATSGLTYGINPVSGLKFLSTLAAGNEGINKRRYVNSKDPKGWETLGNTADYVSSSIIPGARWAKSKLGWGAEARDVPDTEVQREEKADIENSRTHSMLPGGIQYERRRSNYSKGGYVCSPSKARRSC